MSVLCPSPLPRRISELKKAMQIYFYYRNNFCSNLEKKYLVRGIPSYEVADALIRINNNRPL